MKGVSLAGGTGSRLDPLTRIADDLMPANGVNKRCVKKLVGVA